MMTPFDKLRVTFCLLFPFVFGGFVEADDVYHFAEPTSDAVAVAVFNFFGVEVGGYVGYTLQSFPKCFPSGSTPRSSKQKK